MPANYRTNRDQYYNWLLDETGLSLNIENKCYKASDIAILANGTQDILIIDNNGVLEISSINHLYKGRVLYAPKRDIVLFSFCEPLPPPFKGTYLILEIDDVLEPLIREIIARWPAYMYENYEAYIGKRYW